VTLSLIIKSKIPTFEFTGPAAQQLDLIGSHYVSEILALKAQRPTPSPTPVIPKTDPSNNKNVILKTLDENIIEWNKSNTPIQPRGIWENSDFVSKHILDSYDNIFQNIQLGLIVYYNTPNPAAPPPGYPTTPISQPLPNITNPVLNLSAIKARLISDINSKIPQTDPTVVMTSQLQLFLEAWAEFMTTEIFL